MRRLALVKFTSYEESVIDYSIHDILVCKFPDLAIVDASIGQIGGEIWGTPKKVWFNLIW